MDDICLFHLFCAFAPTHIPVIRNIQQELKCYSRVTSIWDTIAITHLGELR